MHPRHSIFTLKKLLITNKNTFRPLEDEAEAVKLVEEFVHSYTDYEKTPNAVITSQTVHSSADELKEKLTSCAIKLKALALGRVPTAIRFYRRLFSYMPSESIPNLSYPLLHEELLNHIKEIGVRNADPNLLFHSYVIRIQNTQVINFEEAFSCLMLAAKMEGPYAIKAASCLAYLYGKELTGQLKLPEKTNRKGKIIKGGGLIKTLKDLYSDLQSYSDRHPEEMMACLLALADFGLKQVPQALAFNDSGTTDEFNSKLSAHYQAEVKTPENCDYLKQAFLHYFNLTFKKSMESGPESITYSNPKKNFILDLDELIDLHILVTHGVLDSARQEEEKNKHDAKILEHANAGKLGAMYIVFLQKQCRSPYQKPEGEWLEKIISTPSKHKNKIIANAADMIYSLQANEEEEGEEKTSESKALQQNAAKLGSYRSTVELGVKAFEQSDFEHAARYFNQTIDYADLHEVLNARQIILYELNDQVSLDTKDKIEFYFQSGADALKDMTDTRRFHCLKYILKTLEKLFPDKDNRPEKVKTWLERPRLETPLPATRLMRAESFFSLLTSAEIDKNFNEIIEFAKNTLKENIRMGYTR